MLNKLIHNLFKPKRKSTSKYIVATLNDKIMPIDRGEVYEDPLDEYLKYMHYGEVTGGGTMQRKTGELDFVDVEICLNSDSTDKEVINNIIKKLELLGAPKGSNLLVEETQEKIPFGINEGLAVYLDGINLSDEVYKNSDTEALILEIRKLCNIKDTTLRYWQGNTETAIYFYAPSFESMNKSIENLIKTHPECENARVVKIA